jgi:tetratricopeptide (TPR) repeat protein
MRRWMFACVMVAALTARAGAGLDVRGTLEQAAAAYTEGGRRLSSDREGALAAFARSAALYKQAVDGGASAALMYNIGSASLLAGEHGDAVLWLKRAARLAPNDGDILANLASAREKVGSALSVRAKDSLLEQLTIIEFVPASARFWIAAAGLGGMWTLALWRVWTVPGGSWRPSRLAVAAFGAAGVLAAGSLVPREMRLREASEAVVMNETTGRAGPDAGAYEAKPASPLKAGTEVRVVEERGGWVLVDLGDGTTTWVEGKGVERVRSLAAG